MKPAWVWDNILSNTDMFASKEIVKKIQLDVFQETLNIVKSMSDKVGNGRLELSYAETHYQNALDDVYETIKDEIKNLT